MARLVSLIAAAVLALIAIVLPPLPFPAKTYDFVYMLDITRSMNVQDYSDADGGAISRLERSKAAMLASARSLPCGSRVGLGVFTERSPALLYSPIDVCKDYPVLEASINELDWRMAWVADSNISQALYNILELMAGKVLNDTKLVFFTDGHEAPPVNPRYAPDYSYIEVLKDREENWRSGLIVGVGQHNKSKIPKFNEDGVQIGYYKAEDVPHASRFGLPADPSKIEGYVPRNGPWGTSKAVGTEHLSNVREEYLKKLGEQAKMNYHHLQDNAGLTTALKKEVFVERQVQPTQLNVIAAGLALLLLAYCFYPFRAKWPSAKTKAGA
jgi:mxaL protein